MVSYFLPIILPLFLKSKCIVKYLEIHFSLLAKYKSNWKPQKTNKIFFLLSWMMLSPIIDATFDLVISVRPTENIFLLHASFEHLFCFVLFYILCDVMWCDVSSVKQYLCVKSCWCDVRVLHCNTKIWSIFTGRGERHKRQFFSCKFYLFCFKSGTWEVEVRELDCPYDYNTIVTALG